MAEATEIQELSVKVDLDDHLADTDLTGDVEHYNFQDRLKDEEDVKNNSLLTNTINSMRQPALLDVIQPHNEHSDQNLNHLMQHTNASMQSSLQSSLQSALQVSLQSPFSHHHHPNIPLQLDQVSPPGSPSDSIQAPESPTSKQKRGRGGKRAGAGRKRKSDTLSTDSIQAKASAAYQMNSASRAAQLHNPEHVERSGKGPNKKKKIYNDSLDTLKKGGRQLKFAYTILYVKDVEKTVDFYEKAFGLKRRFVHESKQYAEMETGGTALSFASNDLAKSNLSTIEFQPNELNRIPPGMEIAFASNNVQRDYKRAVESGASSVSAPKVLPWGQIVAYVRDFNGVLVEIASEMKMKT
eukprot:TRINITY_DN2940_c0_g1_i1.p1 TRINITY_DN2940_c0_g1~~TRINITY_DN2940_c0_g1_i1.p1  ORF type:complete len:354 (-),score=68.00 TRINITY_DN2940_c0_g1_i1:159-1220(-)